MGLYLGIKGKLLRKKHRSKDIATPNIKRREKTTLHSIRLLSSFSKKRINKEERKKKKCRFSSKLCENHSVKYARVHSKSDIRNVGGKHGQNHGYQTGLHLQVRRASKHRPHKIFANKFRHERQNNYKMQDKSKNTIVKSSVKNNDTPALLCEENKKKMREMIIKMNRAVRRSIILARIIGGKFGIDDKTIAAILSKEEENISKNVLDFKKEAVTI